MNTTKAKEFFKKFSDKFLDLLYPEGLTCVNCGDELQHETRLNLCGKCYLNLIENDGHRCKICGIRMKNEADYCDNCTRFDKYFDMNRSPFIYEKTASDLVKKLKFGNKLYIAKELAKAMADEYFTGNFNCDFILYVPMTEKEEKERGYNQSELLAKEVGLRTGLSVFDNLKKVKETDRQKKLTAKERRENLKGVFDVVRADEIKGKNVLVIDDVYTTGATINECARVLKRAGARKVYSITAAQTAFKPDGEKGEIAEDNANALHKN